MTYRSLTNKCIVLDIDETLVHTTDDIAAYKKLKIMDNPEHVHLRDRVYNMEIAMDDGEIYKCWGVVRPHVYEFLEFCFSYFKIVAIWSAGQKEYVDAIVSFLFRDLPRPHIIYSFDDCEIYNKKDKILFKPLSKLTSKSPMRNKMDLKNTMIIDDNEDTFRANIDNAIHIPKYKPKKTIQSITADDDALLRIQMWFLDPINMFREDIRETYATINDELVVITGPKCHFFTGKDVN